MAAGADADAEAGLGREAHQLAGAEAGVEVVARTRGDERLRHVGTGHPEGVLTCGAGGGFLRVDDDGGEVEPGANLFRHRAQAVFGLGLLAEAEHVEHLLRLLEVEPEGHAAELLELADRIERIDQVGAGALLGVGEVKEEDAARLYRHLRQHALHEIHKDRRHVRDHRPVHQGDEVGGPEHRPVVVGADAGDDLLRGDLVEAPHHAKHELAVGKLHGRGCRGVAKRDDTGFRGEIGENRVDRDLAERADVGDVGALGEQGVGHDGAVAAELVHPRVELEVGAFARGGADALAKLGDGADRREILALAGTLGHRGHDGVHKAVEADEGALLGEGGALGAELLQGAGLEVHAGG